MNSSTYVWWMWSILDPLIWYKFQFILWIFLHLRSKMRVLIRTANRVKKNIKYEQAIVCMFTVYWTVIYVWCDKLAVIDLSKVTPFCDFYHTYTHVNSIDRRKSSDLTSLSNFCIFNKHFIHYTTHTFGRLWLEQNNCNFDFFFSISQNWIDWQAHFLCFCHSYYKRTIHLNVHERRKKNVPTKRT